MNSYLRNLLAKANRSIGTTESWGPPLSSSKKRKVNELLKKEYAIIRKLYKKH